jgi:hypothetical protein
MFDFLNKFIKKSGTRVEENTSANTLQEIRTQTLRNLKHFAQHPEGIKDRLKELNREWDTERVLEANAATLAFAGTILGFTVNRKWFYLPGVVTAFLLQHALQGWCPPLPIIRNIFKVRTRHEIDEEVFALKSMRGDFEQAKAEEQNTEKKAYQAYGAATG